MTGTDALATARANHRALLAKVDDFFSRVQTRHASDIQCASGCHDCCQADLTVTGVEADVITTHLDTLGESERAALRVRAQDATSDRCAALDDAGRCGIYPARPLVCRSHGLPLRLRNQQGLPVLDACFRNFKQHGPQAADPDCILDQETLSAVLLTVARVFAQAAGQDPLARTPLAALLSR